MADTERLIRALKAADAAGDAEAATKLAQTLRSMQPQGPVEKPSYEGRGDVPTGNVFGSILRGATGGALDYSDAAVGWMTDRIPGKFQKPEGQRRTYEQALQDVRGAQNEFREKSPVQAYGGEIAGAVTSPLFRGVASLAEGGVNAATRASPRIAQALAGNAGKFARFGLQGAAQGATAGALSAQNDKGGIPTARDLVGSVGGAAAGGAALGVAVPALAQGAGRVAQDAAQLWGRKAPAPSQETIRNASNAAYKAASDAGVVVKPEAFKQFVDDLPSQLEGFRPRLAPKAADVIAEMKGDVEAGKPITLDLLDELRKVARGASKTTDRNEIRLISSIVEKLDDFIDELKPQQLLAGDSEKAAASLKEARSLWRTNVKLRNIDEILEIGENLNDTNWVRNQFRSIVRKPKLFNQYTEEEQALIKQLARTGTMENLARMQPFRGVQMAAPHLAQVGQEVKAGQLQDLIARGGSTGGVSGPSIPPAVVEALTKSAVPAASPFSRSGGSNQRPYRER